MDLLPPKPMAELYADDIVTNCLTHWDRSMHIINKLAIIGSDNGLSAGQPQAIIWAELFYMMRWHIPKMGPKIGERFYFEGSRLFQQLN